MYYTDTPISYQKEDQLGFAGFSRYLAKAVTEYCSQETLCIGIFGKWGSGKTSIINMMLEELNKKDSESEDENKPLVIHFNPWNFSSADQLLGQFFIRLMDTFQHSNDDKLSRAGEALQEYADAFEFATLIPKIGPLVALAGKWGLTKVGKGLVEKGSKKDISKQRDAVIKILEDQPKKILIVIDDIDRLGNEQIRQVFRLVTAVAKFPKTTYLLSFDRDIVVNALEQVQEGDGNDYLEKIIQIPIYIPDISVSQMQSILIEKLNGILAEYGTMFEQNRWRQLFEPCIAPYIKSLRGINRLCNLVRFKLSCISAEVEFSSMVSISAIELFLPSVYEWIKENKTTLTGSISQMSLGDQRGKKEELKKEYTAKLMRILSRGKKDQVEAEWVDIALKSIVRLFPYFGQKIGMEYEVMQENELRRTNQVAHPEKFDRYFSLDENGIFIKTDSIQSAVESFSKEELVRFFEIQSQKERADEAITEIRARLKQIGAERAEVIASALFDVTASLKGQTGWLRMDAKDVAIYLIQALVNLLPEEQRFCYLSKELSRCTMDSLKTFATFLNLTELAFGRLAAQGTERDFEKLISLEQLDELEQLFVARVKELIPLGYNMLARKDERMVLYLMENFDPIFAETHIKELLGDMKNQLCYLSHSVSKWTGTSIRYEIQNGYRKYLSAEQAIEAIETLQSQGEIADLDLEVKNAVAAFYIKETKGGDFLDGVSQSAVDELLKDWNAA